MNKLKTRLYHIVFGTDTPAGKAFDLVLVFLIFASVIVVVLESISELKVNFSREFYLIEWGFTIVFSLEYLLRIWISKKPFRYIFSFLGLIDFFSILPTFLSFFFPGTQSLMVIRMLRLLRVFRILKMVRFIQEAQLIALALKSSLRKIIVFIMTVLTIVTITGTLMYLIEGEESGFTNIPKGMYWAIVTLTTVGFGDITPVTPLGQLLASFIMLMGYAIIAVPTGLVTAEFVYQRKQGEEMLICNNCGHIESNNEAKFCQKCGVPFEQNEK